MSNLAQNIDTRPSEIPPPPASERKPRVRNRKPRPAAAPGPTEARSTLEPSPPDTTEEFHRKRIARRIAQERHELAEHAQAYVEIANEVGGYSDNGEDVACLPDLPTGVVLALAIGARPADPLTAILEEIRIRCGTLMRTARGARSAGPELDTHDVLETLDRELDMLQTRAAVAGELVRRFGGLRDLCNPLRTGSSANEGG